MLFSVSTGNRLHVKKQQQALRLTVNSQLTLEDPCLVSCSSASLQLPSTEDIWEAPVMPELTGFPPSIWKPSLCSWLLALVPAQPWQWQAFGE